MSSLFLPHVVVILILARFSRCREGFLCFVNSRVVVASDGRNVIVPLRGHRRIVLVSSWLQCAAPTHTKLSPYQQSTGLMFPNVGLKGLGQDLLVHLVVPCRWHHLHVCPRKTNGDGRIRTLGTCADCANDMGRIAL